MSLIGTPPPWGLETSGDAEDLDWWGGGMKRRWDEEVGWGIWISYPVWLQHDDRLLEFVVKCNWFKENAPDELINAAAEWMNGLPAWASYLTNDISAHIPQWNCYFKYECDPFIISLRPAVVQHTTISSRLFQNIQLRGPISRLLALLQQQHPNPRGSSSMEYLHGHYGYAIKRNALILHIKVC